jgi:phosphonate transport system substrate-binding protein
MNRHTFLRLSLTGLAASAASRVWGSAGHLRIGLTPVILADQAAFLARWSDYLARQLGSPVTFFARESYQGVLNLLFSGQLDAAWICGYPYTRYRQQLQLLAVPLFQGQPLYQAYLIRPKQPRPVIHSWADLKGRVLAYSDPLSNSGWLVAQAKLHALGVGPGDLQKSFFAHSHRNVAEAVGARLAHAGAIDGYVWETMRQQQLAGFDHTEVVWRSEPYGFPPIVVRQGARHPKTQQLQNILLGMASEAEGQTLLKALNLTGFEQGSPALFASIAIMAAETEARLA